MKRRLRDREKQLALDDILYPEWKSISYECAKSGEDPFRLAACMYHCIRYDDVTLQQLNHARSYYNGREIE